MNNDSFIKSTAKALCTSELLGSTYLSHERSFSMPSVDTLAEIVEDIRSIIFPGYFGTSELRTDTMEYCIGAKLDTIYTKLTEEIKRGFYFSKAEGDKSCDDCETRSVEICEKFILRLPHIRHLLLSDAQAAYEGDPASRSVGETIFCYPSIRALTNQRIAHELFLLDVPFIPRIITELAHSQTGIDIHPGASIGERCFIDHGTGVVVGETCIIGRNVRIYQGVTLGAKSFPLDENGNPIKGIPRHPVVEDDVVVYAGATILGRITIGQGSVVGGNVWITSDLPPGSRVLQKRQNDAIYSDGSGV